MAGACLLELNFAYEMLWIAPPGAELTSAHPHYQMITRVQGHVDHFGVGQIRLVRGATGLIEVEAGENVQWEITDSGITYRKGDYYRGIKTHMNDEEYNEIFKAQELMEKLK